MRLALRLNLLLIAGVAAVVSDTTGPPVAITSELVAHLNGKPPDILQDDGSEEARGEFIPLGGVRMHAAIVPVRAGDTIIGTLAIFHACHGTWANLCSKWRGGCASCVHPPRPPLRPLNGLFHGIPGERGFELIPAEMGNKGTAVRHELAMAGRAALPVFVGDDAVDEPAFAALAGGITIRVGHPCRTRARFRLDDVKQVRMFLERLVNEVH